MINSLLNHSAKCIDILQLQQSNQSSSSPSLSLSPLLSSSLSSSSSSDINVLLTPENIEKKLQKNNIQNTVTREHIRVDRKNDISNVSNSIKTNESKKD